MIKTNAFGEGGDTVHIKGRQYTIASSATRKAMLRMFVGGGGVVRLFNNTHSPLRW